jgi:hypothetical protein
MRCVSLNAGLKIKLALSLAGGLALPLAVGSAPRSAADGLNVLDFAPAGGTVDRGGSADASAALAAVITAANGKTAKGEPACVHIPAGVYRIRTPPPAFVKAGCVRGDGPTQTTLDLDPEFEGDLFAWSEAWIPTVPGPTAAGFRVRGGRAATRAQNALVFYDRNDQVVVEDVEVLDLHGRALYSGVAKHAPQAYMRESRLRSLRFFRCGAPGIPVVEFNSQGRGDTDATNEIRLSMVDIYGPRGPGFVIRNNGSGTVGGITADMLRIEGTEHGTTQADLLTIGDPVMGGIVHAITFTALELIDPYPGFAALRVTAPPQAPVPYQITVTGIIGGGLAFGEGLRLDAGRTSTFRLSGIHTTGTNVVIGPGVSEILIDGGGQESQWTYRIDPSSRGGISVPARVTGDPSGRR